MLSTRLWVGAVLIGVTVVVLVFDLPDYNYPGFWILLVGLALAACSELMGLLGPKRHLPTWLCQLGVISLLSANWLPRLPGLVAFEPHPWPWIVGVLAGFVFIVFVTEMAVFRGPSDTVVRMALTLWVILYIGLLPCFLAQLRWIAEEPGGTVALGLAVFVPKCCDIGAYFTGRFLGRYRMSPVLSPKKTWEGAVGGLVTAVLATAAIDRLGPVPLLQKQWWAELGFGLTVGVAGMIGDLAESLIKRDCRQKDASQTVPGFGGVLDVIDALLLAAPVAYVWLRIMKSLY